MKMRFLLMRGGRLILIVILFSIFPLVNAAAGFVPDEEPINSIEAAGSMLTTSMQVSSVEQASYPHTVMDGFVVYPGSAWAVRMFYSKESCFRVWGGESKYVNYKGNPCNP